MPKTIIHLDSHQLSAFQRCPRSYFLGYKAHKEAKKDKVAFVRGNVMHDLLYHFYSLKIKGEPFEKCVTGAIELCQTGTFKLRWDALIGDARILILRKFAEYSKYYRNEILRPVGVEVGFSKIFYEDDMFLFMYEGKIDFIAEIERGRIAWADHKTQAFKYELIPEVNQFMGYSWALNYNTGLINYIGLQESLPPKDSMRRTICSYTPQLIEEWRKVTLRAFFQIAALRDDVTNYEKHRTGCQIGKFGNCDFLRACHEPSLVVLQGILEREYQQRDIWIPWE